METYNTHEAKTQLSRIIARVEAGEEIFIARAGKPVVRLSKVSAPLQNNPPRRPGGWEGKIWLADDWDSKKTNEEIADLFHNSKVSQGSDASS